MTKLHDLLIFEIMFFHRAEELRGNRHDLVNIAKQVLNKSASNRLISKQECMVLLGGLDLVTCSETIESVSLTLSAKVVVSEEDKKKAKKRRSKTHQKIQRSCRGASTFVFP
jgi:hypothetical protein